MAEWDTAYVNNLPDSAFAVILPGGTKDAEGKTTPRSLRKLPHHDANGNLDMPHLASAMSREPQTDMPDAAHQTAMRHLMSHERASGMGQGKAEPLEPDERAAWYAGQIPRRVRIIPFGGPVPSADGKGRDLDGEYFDAATDIKPHWFSERPVLWHHGADPTGLMADTVLGKAVNLHREDDGWWEDFWLRAGESRLARVRSLEERGATLFASSTPLQTPGIRTGKARDGRITVWPHAESTLSTSPQNTFAVVRPAKAVLDDFLTAQIDVLPLAKAWVADLDALSADLRETLTDPTGSAGDPTAKAGRELSAANLAALKQFLEAIGTNLGELSAWLAGRNALPPPKGTPE